MVKVISDSEAGDADDGWKWRMIVQAGDDDDGWKWLMIVRLVMKMMKLNDDSEATGDNGGESDW